MAMFEDRFAWLEEVEGPEALDWVRKQNQRTLAELEADPLFAELHADALTLANANDRMTFGGLSGGYVYNFWQDETNVRGLWRRASWESWRSKAPQWETLLDIDALAQNEDANWVFKGAQRLDSEDPGSRCLVVLSNGGKDASRIREFDLATKAFVTGGFDLPEAKTMVEWLDHDTLLVATDWGAGTRTKSGYPFVVKMLRRGKGLESAEELFRGEVSDELMTAPARIDDGTQFHHFIVRAPQFFTREYFWLAPAGASRQLTKLNLPPKTNLLGIREGRLCFQVEEDISLGSTNLHSGGVYCARLATLAADAAPDVETVVEPGARETIASVSFAPDGVYVASAKSVRGQARRFSRNSAGQWQETLITLPRDGIVGVSASPRRSEVLYTYQDLLTPPSLLDADFNTLEAEPVRFDASDLQVTQFHAKSSDGEAIPYFEVRKKDLASDSETPTLLYGYGGFNVPLFPDYRPGVGKLWLERGGAFILANIRGGGEFGPNWHQAGLKTKRQAIYDDFIAVAEDLIARNLTQPKKLGIVGGSNGGLLMGAMLAQRPELFGAAVVQVPLLDMLRFHLLLAGASWVDEYGSPDELEERAFLERISPYHNIDPENIRNVEPFFVTSTKDDRVHPAHARKLGAKIEAAGVPFYYFENIDGGHGAAANRLEAARRQALEFTYLSRRLMRDSD